MIEKLLTAPQIAEILQISKAKVHILIQRGEIPYIRLERNVRVKESDLLRWIEKRTVRNEI